MFEPFFCCEVKQDFIDLIEILVIAMHYGRNLTDRNALQYTIIIISPLTLRYIRTLNLSITALTCTWALIRFFSLKGSNLAVNRYGI